MLKMNCTDCPLHIKRTLVVMPTACLPGGLLAIGEAPGADEDIAGEGFVGRAGKTLDALLLEVGIDRASYGRANICRCRPVDAQGENRKPTAREADACLPKLAAFIAETKPSVILCVGWTPAKYFFSDKCLGDAIAQSSGRTFIPGQMGLPSILRGLISPVRVVPMPHTSPLAFNRNAPSGEKWSIVARRQVALAKGLLLP